MINKKLPTLNEPYKYAVRAVLARANNTRHSANDCFVVPVSAAAKDASGDIFFIGSKSAVLKTKSGRVALNHQGNITNNVSPKILTEAKKLISQLFKAQDDLKIKTSKVYSLSYLLKNRP